MKSILLLLSAAAANGQTVRYIEVDPKSVESTERSGFAGPQETVREPGFNAFLHGLEFAETANKPCYLKAHWWRYTAQNQPSAFTTQFDICGKTAKVDDSLVFATKPDLRLAIDSVRVCSNQSDNHRIKGVELTAASVDRFASENVENKLQKDSFDHANCKDSKAVRSCEAGKVAVGLVIHHSKDEITGLSLKCGKPEVNPVKVSGGGSPQERYAKMESDIRVTAGKDGQTEIMTIREAIERHEVAGATVVVLEGGDVSVVRHYGLRNKRRISLPTRTRSIKPHPSAN